MNSKNLNNIESKWYAIGTRYKCEKQVLKDLFSKQIDAYVPLIEKVKRYSKKIKRYQIPLINCYVFVKIDNTEKAKVLQTEHVINFIKPGKELTAIPQYEIDVLKRLVGDLDHEVEVLTEGLLEGDDVEIIKGPLLGLKGKMISKENKNVVIINLENLGFQFCVTMHKSLLSKI
jgi:transcription antitermination factor NusG